MANGKITWHAAKAAIEHAHAELRKAGYRPADLGRHDAHLSIKVKTRAMPDVMRDLARVLGDGYEIWPYGPCYEMDLHEVRVMAKGA